jgi:hypothetical protein
MPVWYPVILPSSAGHCCVISGDSAMMPASLF